MTTSSDGAPNRLATGWLQARNSQLADLDRCVQTPTLAQDCPQASGILQGVPVYDARGLRAAQAAASEPALWRQQLMAEWAQVWSSGAGVLVVQGLYAHTAVVDAATREFQSLIMQTRAVARAVTTLPNPAPMTGSGTRWKNSVCRHRTSLPPTTATHCWPLSAKPG
jgi:hypothetical protein